MDIRDYRRTPGAFPTGATIVTAFDAGDHEILPGRVAHYDHALVPPLVYSRDTSLRHRHRKS